MSVPCLGTRSQLEEWFLGVLSEFSLLQRLLFTAAVFRPTRAGLGMALACNRFVEIPCSFASSAKFRGTSTLWHATAGLVRIYGLSQYGWKLPYGKYTMSFITLLHTYRSVISTPVTTQLVLSDSCTVQFDTWIWGAPSTYSHPTLISSESPLMWRCG